MLNNCNFIGRLTADIDLKFIQNGSAVANFTVACGEKWKDKNTGEQKEVTEFVRCTLWNKQAENASKFLSKGSLVYVSGKMATRSFEQDGIKKYITEIKVNQITFLDTKQSGQSTQRTPDSQQNNTGSGGGGEYYSSQGGNQSEPMFSDEIPF